MSINSKKEYSKTLENAILLLECFEKHEELGITDLAKQLGLGKASISRFVASFENHGILSQNENKKYRLGYKLILLGYLAQERQELRHTLKPVMDEIVSKFQVTSHLVVPDNKGKLIIIEKISEGPFIYMSSLIGGTMSYYSSSVGKVILANSSSDKVDEYINTFKFESFTDKTITDPDEFREELLLTKKRGYGIDDEETHTGLFCIGFPIFDYNGNVMGALSISGQKSFIKSSLDTIVKGMIEIFNRHNIIYK